MSGLIERSLVLLLRSYLLRNHLPIPTARRVAPAAFKAMEAAHVRLSLFDLSIKNKLLNYRS